MIDENERKITVEVADYTGHSVVQLDRDETLDLVSKSDGWVYSNGRRIDSEELSRTNWSCIVTISIMPRIQYG